MPGNLHLSLCKAIAKENILIAAQNVSAHPPGFYTGEVPADAIKDYEINYVLIGHHERRLLFGEDQQAVTAKCKNAEDCQLNIVYCVGESQEQREAEHTETVVFEQLKALIEAGVSDWGKCIIVYEPLWAMNTSVIASADQTQEACEMIRNWVATNVSKEAAAITRIVYGGNVTETNAANFVRLPDVDGFLVGSTSTKPIFRKIFDMVAAEAAQNKW